jgi:acetyltransferase
MAIIAEVENASGRVLVGVGRLVADSDHETAEYAILIGDRWQGLGLGLLLTGYCLEIAKTWGLIQVVATTEWTNSRMLATFRHFGFALTDDPDEGVVCAAKRIV